MCVREDPEDLEFMRPQKIHERREQSVCFLGVIEASRIAMPESNDKETCLDGRNACARAKDIRGSNCNAILRRH